MKFLIQCPSPPAHRPLPIAYCLPPIAHYPSPIAHCPSLTSCLKIPKIGYLANMRIWLTSFIVLFGAAELWQWAQHLSLPLPMFVLGGVFLAVASNYDKLKNLPFHLDYEDPQAEKAARTAKVVKAVEAASKKRSPSRSISFEINKTFKPGD